LTRRHEPPARVEEPLTATPTGVRLLVHVQPRARRTEVVGRHGDAIRIRLAAPPVDGAANEALLRFLADRLGVARPAVTLLSGQTSRSKRVEVTGIDVATAADRLADRG
jgi:uncharacterized protein (TIGR00251 family)